MISKLTDLEVDEYHRQGQELYRQHKYQAALQRFNAVLQQERRAPLNTLDNRAATYAKLGNLHAALRDGRSMIEEYKTSCSGYLRTAKLLQLLDKHEAALNIYKYGIRNVPLTDPNRRLLQGMCDKLVKRGLPGKAVDPLQALPFEVARMIFEYLNFRQMVNATGVSHSWRALLHSMPNLWSHLDFSATAKNVSMATVTAYIKRSRGRAKIATLAGFSPSQCAMLKCIANRCKTLVQLQICHGLTGSSLLEAAPALKCLEVLVVGAGIGLDAVTQILPICGRLKRAEFSCVFGKHRAQWTGDLSRLQSLTIGAKIDPNDCSLQHETLLQLSSLIPRLGNIKELKIRRWIMRPANVHPGVFLDFSNLTQLETLELACLDPPTFPSLPCSIQNLDISSWPGRNTNGGFHPANLATLDNLSSLSLRLSNFFSFVDFCTLLEPNRGYLRTLDISRSTQLSKDDVVSLALSGYFSGLVELVVTATELDDKAVEAMAAHLPSLTILDISSTYITGISVKALANNPGSKLMRLNLDHCRNVGVDAVEYARSQGIEVSFKFPELNYGKAKRLRTE